MKTDLWFIRLWNINFNAGVGAGIVGATTITSGSFSELLLQLD
jgi:hypothetical protein